MTTAQAPHGDLPPRPQRRKRRRAGAPGGSGGRSPAKAPPSSGPPTAPVFGSSGMRVPSNIGGHRAVEPVADTNVPRFSAATSALFDRIDAALLHLRPPVNEFLEVELDGGTILRIKLGPELGTYELHADEDRCVLEMTSPTGSFTYVLERSTGDFVEEADGHSLVGLLTRDLIRQIQGYPNF
eukprot:CAMPEP_0194296640 /NCGR_PEP_ID=MMETSP0169-20130528/56733_1 /TAXON_ID=218684 /ORGANISM="Corethron pennatum, Strain L29A3" /LENGTH=182 /DNA_ID=CAMNT_0039046171 /DNA_START=139 /DNA_END=687 /DNA_ORIENTATION=+